MSGVPSRMPPMLRWRMRFQPENFPMLMMCLSRLHFLKRPMHRSCWPNDPISRLMVLGGPLIGWCLARTSSRWSGLGLQRMRRLLIKKLLGHSLAIGGPLTRGTFPLSTCTIFTLTASMHQRWLVGRNTPSPFPST